MIDFRFIPVDSVWPHESTSGERTISLCELIENDKQIRHPILATKVDNKYMILDGHHRFNALKKLGVKFIPLQVVCSQDIDFQYWYHAFPKNIKINSEKNGIGRYIGRGMSSNGEFDLYCEPEKVFIELWNIYNQYRANYTRTHTINSEFQWVIYDGIRLDDIILWSIQQKETPPGISRFLIKNRILNLNIPIKYLFDFDNAILDKLKNKISKGRYYNEPIVYIE